LTDRTNPAGSGINIYAERAVVIRAAGVPGELRQIAFQQH
jgi:hypothetical protein